MKIAYVIGELGVGGAEQQLLRKLELFRERGVDLIVVALSQGGNLADAYAERGFRVHQLRRRGPRDLGRLQRLTAILARERPDIVHGEQYDAGAYARVAGTLARVPVRVLAIRSAYERLRWRYRASELALKRVTHGYIVNAEAIKTRTMRFHGVRSDRVFVHYNVFDPRLLSQRSPEAVRRELGIRAGEIVFGIVASFSPEKNHELFLEFCARLMAERGDVRFLMVGDGPRRPRIQAHVERLGLTRDVELLGLRRDVPDLLRAMNVSVNTSIREGLCNALLESLASGVPVLASRVGGTTELVREGRHGELFTSGSVDDMLAAARRLLDDLPGYASRVAADRDAILTPFEEQSIADAMIATYAELCERSGHEPRSRSTVS